MPDLDHDHDQFGVEDLLDHAVVAHSDAMDVVRADEFLGADGPRVRGQRLDRVHNPLAVLLRADPCEFLSRGRLDAEVKRGHGASWT